MTGAPDKEQSEENGGKPRVGNEVLGQAALLQFLASRGISAPTLLAYDACAKNALQSPYVFQGCSKGTPFDKVYDTMSLGDKLYVDDELVRTIVSAEGITFPQSGIAIAGRSGDIPEAASYLFGTEGPALPLEIKPSRRHRSLTLSLTCSKVTSRKNGRLRQTIRL